MWVCFCFVLFGAVRWVVCCVMSVDFLLVAVCQLAKFRIDVICGTIVAVYENKRVSGPGTP